MIAAPRVCVLRAPGTNCDAETCFAFDQAGGVAENVHLFELLETPSRLANYQILCIPGGFSYGDDIGAGVIFASQFRRQMGELLFEHLERDTLTLGICNGFQVLLKAGLLPGGASGWQHDSEPLRTTTLTWNNNGKYTARWVNLVCDSPQNVFLRGISQLELPIAHAEGRICVSDPAQIFQWQAAGQIALRYCDVSGQITDAILPEPVNPNGSIANIAGLGDPSGRVLGLMPHPERFLKATHHPQWTRKQLTGDGQGMQLFRNAIEYFAAK
ncbi:MAG: phosphoribosylformylglycinamidine synthase I [Planctomycetaceae bacterium]|nr:phosphoribosylformylglycinamidine synthase I [Planctomycetaceae bacterium]